MPLLDQTARPVPTEAATKALWSFWESDPLVPAAESREGSKQEKARRTGRGWQLYLCDVICIINQADDMRRQPPTPSHPRISQKEREKRIFESLDYVPMVERSSKDAYSHRWQQRKNGPHHQHLNGSNHYHLNCYRVRLTDPSSKDNATKKEENTKTSDMSSKFSCIMHINQKAILLWLLLLAPKSIAVSPGRKSPLNRAVAVSGGTKSEVFHTHDIEIGRRRAEFVRHILSDRLKYVENGKRMADFHSWLRKRGGDVAVLSTHGVDVDVQTFPAAQPPNYYHYDENEHMIHLFRNDPFAVDKLDLDLPANTLPNLYEGKPIHLIDDLQPSSAQLFVRAIQLGLKFAPVLSTTLLAAVSQKFRKVWYKWLATSLGKSSTSLLRVVDSNRKQLHHLRQMALLMIHISCTVCSSIIINMNQ
jgi:hypothetical protein